MTDEILALMDTRDKYKNMYNRYREDFFFDRYKELRNEVNHKIRRAKIDEFNKTINDKVKESKTFHNTLKNTMLLALTKTKRTHEKLLMNIIIFWTELVLTLSFLLKISRKN